MSLTSPESDREHLRRRFHLLHYADKLTDPDFRAAIDAEMEAADALFRELVALKGRIRELHRPVTLMGQVWCDECSTQRQTGPRTTERIAYIPHPCPTVQTLGAPPTP